MKIVFRVDASVYIGTGHVMRCLTLADALQNRSFNVSFICREHRGNLIQYIKDKGYHVFTLEAGVAESEQSGLNISSSGDSELPHASWLGVTQEEDADCCASYLAKVNPDWLIVDHYSIDYHWHDFLIGNFQKFMVIDDLADRKHKCNILLDQTYGREADDYQTLIPQDCRLLLGARFTLLRPEFLQWREYSIRRRKRPALNKILVTMGGVDSDNVTGQVLDVLMNCEFVKDLLICVVMGKAAPNIEKVRRIAEMMPFKTEVKVNVGNMAELMAEADLAIGAVGATTWERCALGLPAIMIIVADNQMFASITLAKANIGWIIQKPDEISEILGELVLESQAVLLEKSKSSIKITDGMGVVRVCDFLI